MDVSKHLVHWNIVRSDPADPGEVAESLEDVSWEEVPYSGSEERVEEEAFAAETTTVTNTSICLSV